MSFELKNVCPHFNLPYLEQQLPLLWLLGYHAATTVCSNFSSNHLMQLTFEYLQVLRKVLGSPTFRVPTIRDRQGLDSWMQ